MEPTPKRTYLVFTPNDDFATHVPCQYMLIDTSGALTFIDKVDGETLTVRAYAPDAWQRVDLARE